MVLSSRLETAWLTWFIDFQTTQPVYIHLLDIAEKIASEHYLMASLLIMCFLRAIKFLKMMPYVGPATNGTFGHSIGDSIAPL
jgi:hypothetical protein